MSRQGPLEQVSICILYIVYISYIRKSKPNGVHWPEPPRRRQLMIQILLKHAFLPAQSFKQRHFPSSPRSGALNPEYGTRLNLPRRLEHQSVSYNVTWPMEVLSCPRGCANYSPQGSGAFASSYHSLSDEILLKKLRFGLHFFQPRVCATSLPTNGKRELTWSCCPEGCAKYSSLGSGASASSRDLWPCGATPSYKDLRATPVLA